MPLSPSLQKIEEQAFIETRVRHLMQYHPSMETQPSHTQPSLGAHRSLMKNTTIPKLQSRHPSQPTTRPSPNLKSLSPSPATATRPTLRDPSCYHSPFINAAASTSPQPKAPKHILNLKARKHTTFKAMVKGRQHHKAGRQARTQAGKQVAHHQAPPPPSPPIKKHTKQPKVLRTQCISVPATQRPSIINRRDAQGLV